MSIERCREILKELRTYYETEYPCSIEEKEAMYNEYLAQLQDELKDVDPEEQDNEGLFIWTCALNVPDTINGEVEKNLNRLLKWNPMNTSYWKEYISYKFKQQDWVSLYYSLRLLVKYFPDKYEYQLSLCQLYRNYNTQLTQLLNGQPDEPTRQALLSLDACIPLIKQAILLGTNCADTWKEFGLVLFKKSLVNKIVSVSELKKSLKCLQKSLDLLTAEGSVHMDLSLLFNLGIVQKVMLRFRDSLSVFKQALKIDTNFVEAREMLDDIMTITKRSNKCLKYGGRYGEIQNVKDVEDTGDLLEGNLENVKALQPLAFRVLRFINNTLPTIVIGNVLKSKMVLPIALYCMPRDMATGCVLKLYSARLGFLDISYLNEDLNDKAQKMPVVYVDRYTEGCIEVNGIPVAKDDIEPFNIVYDNS